MQYTQAPESEDKRTVRHKQPRYERAGVQKHRPSPRPPSYVHTQARNPAYLRIRRLCDTLENACKAANGNRAALEQAHSAFCAGMKSHIAMASDVTLQCMGNAKQLVLLVLEQVKRARTLSDNFEDTTEFDRLLDCFPLRASERDYSLYQARVAAIQAEVAMETANKRDKEDKQMAAQGSVRITWEESDDDLSPSAYGSI